MKKYTANDGTFWVSELQTKEGITIAFCYAWESAIEEASERIYNKYSQFIDRSTPNDLWLKTSAENSITIEELKDIVSMDQTDSIVLFNMDSNSVIAGVSSWFDPNSLEAL